MAGGFGILATCNQGETIMAKKETLKQAGYRYVRFLGEGQHLLQQGNSDPEVWVTNKNHASYGLVYKNTHLEFAYSAKIELDN